MKSWTLKYLDGDFTIVTPPPVLDANFQMHSKLVYLYLQELRSAIGAVVVWPAENVAQPIYSAYALHFRKLGAILNPPIDTDLLDPISRHHFFVCTEPVAVDWHDKPLPGLSGLEQLMGFAHSDPNVERTQSATTTGDAELDVLVDTLLIFKGRGYQIAQMLGVEDLCKACKQANDRMRVASEDAESTVPDEPWEENKDYLKQKDEINSQLQKLGIQMPRVP